ncbi:unnamed protein product [Mytilus coruscus]|uniref:Uncharacterized protein n=1 Tax=Mytilus coruscus TaxID=42192 RepID=A0A6J8DEJ6_MYTCO|nr:unnamed protein product [Mytilus coruscus]
MSVDGTNILTFKLVTFMQLLQETRQWQCDRRTSVIQMQSGNQFRLFKSCKIEIKGQTISNKYLRNPENLDSDKRDPTDTKMCMALNYWNSGHPSISPENCDFQFKVSCEAKNTHSDKKDVDDGTQICPGIGNFIQWDPSTSCINHVNFDQLKENWTGIMRSPEMLTSTAPEENDKWKPLQCKIKEEGTSEDLMLIKFSPDNCSDLMSFYCGNGVIVGIVSLIITIGIVVFVVIVVRRRRSAMRKPVLKQDAHGQSDTEKIEHSVNQNCYAYSEMEATNKTDYMDNERAVLQNSVQSKRSSIWCPFRLQKGQKGKEAFTGHPLCRIITKCCSRVFPKSKVTDMEEVLIGFLKQAPHKPGGPKYKKPVRKGQTISQEELESEQINLMNTPWAGVFENIELDRDATDTDICMVMDCRHKIHIFTTAVIRSIMRYVVIEEEITDLKEEDKINTEDVWFGKYELLTNRAYFRGCFLINRVFQHFGTDCYCIGDIDSFVKRKNCTCVGCNKVWEHIFSDYGTADKNDKCIAASQCLGGKGLKRSYEKCNKTYDVICDK